MCLMKKKGGGGGNVSCYLRGLRGLPPSSSGIREFIMLETCSPVSILCACRCFGFSCVRARCGLPTASPKRVLSHCECWFFFPVPAVMTLQKKLNARHNANQMLT